MTFLTKRNGIARIAHIATATMILGLLASGTVELASASASTSALPPLPSHSLPGAQKADTVMVPVTKGTGTKVLHAFTARKTTVYVQVACSGSGALSVPGMFKISSCKAKPSVFGYAFSVPKAWAYHPVVTTSPTTKWEIIITEGPKTA